VSLGPAISVIVPVYNSERYLAESLASILEQHHRPLELIVVDDGSTDGTGVKLTDFAKHHGEETVRILSQERAGIGAALNRGLRAATGSVLAFLDADDIWAPEKLERQLPVLETEGRSTLVFGWAEWFHSPELSEAERANLPAADLVPGIHRGTLLCYRDTFARVGEFDERWQFVEFVDWYARAMEWGLRAVVISDVVMRRRLHAANTTRGDVDYRDYARVLAAARQRRRRSAGEPRATR
jgi:glycosyltransferase involved in cell wall biosynthesis